MTTWIVIKVSIIQKKNTYTYTRARAQRHTEETHRERGTNHRRGRVGGGGGGGRKGSVSRGISNAVINRKSKRVKRAGREIKSDGRTACIVHGCISAPWKPARHNCELRWSRTGIYLFAAARSLFMTKMHQRPVSAPPPPCSRPSSIDDAPIFYRNFRKPRTSRYPRPAIPPPPSFFGTVVDLGRIGFEDFYPQFGLLEREEGYFN